MKKTSAELRRELAEVEAEERKEREQKRINYEASREELVEELCIEAAQISGLMEDFKPLAFAKLNAFKAEMMKYGDLRRGEKNKGSFELKTDKWKVVFASQTTKRFDERAFMAEQKINEFLKSFLRKKDRGTYDLVTSLLKRDEETGQFDIDMINRLYTIEDRFNDPNWKEGIAMFKEAYAPAETSQYVRFYTKNLETGGWDLLVLDFAKVKGAIAEKEVSNAG